MPHDPNVFQFTGKHRALKEAIVGILLAIAFVVFVGAVAVAVTGKFLGVPIGK